MQLSRSEQEQYISPIFEEFLILRRGAKPVHEKLQRDDHKLLRTAYENNTNEKVFKTIVYAYLSNGCDLPDVSKFKLNSRKTTFNEILQKCYDEEKSEKQRYREKSSTITAPAQQQAATAFAPFSTISAMPSQTKSQPVQAAFQPATLTQTFSFQPQSMQQSMTLPAKREQSSNFFAPAKPLSMNTTVPAFVNLSLTQPSFVDTSSSLQDSFDKSMERRSFSPDFYKRSPSPTGSTSSEFTDDSFENDSENEYAAYGYCKNYRSTRR